MYTQFIFGRDHEFYGQAQNPWLTGTAGWMYTAATRHILGIRPHLHHLVIDPCIPSTWDGFRVQRYWRGIQFDIEVLNPHHVCAGVSRIMVDGVDVPVTQGPHRQYAQIDLGDLGSQIHLKIMMG